jgi:hypothetical protein
MYFFGKLFAYIYYGIKRTSLALKSAGEYFKYAFLGLDNKNKKTKKSIYSKTLRHSADVDGYKRIRNGKEHYVSNYTRKKKNKFHQPERDDEHDDIPYYDFKDNSDDYENSESNESETIIRNERGGDD